MTLHPRYRANASIVELVEELAPKALAVALERIGIRRTGVRSRDEIALIRYKIEENDLARASVKAIDFAKIPVVEIVRWEIKEPFATAEIERLFPNVELL